MLRITRHDDDSGTSTLRLEGRITPSELASLLEAVRTCLDAGRALQLDLGGVGFVHVDGAAALRQLRDEGADLLRASPFLRELMKEISR